MHIIEKDLYVTQNNNGNAKIIIKGTTKTHK